MASIRSTLRSILRNRNSQRANRPRVQRQGGKARRVGRQHRALEQLEKRLLLAIDVSGASGSPVFSGDVSADVLTLSLSTNRELQYSTDGINFIQDMDTSTPAIELLVIDSITQIEVGLGAGADSLVIDSSLSDALQAEGIELIVTGGDDDDTLIGPDANSAWELTGDDSGSLNTWITFSGVENLVGGSAADTFAIRDGGGVVWDDRRGRRG